MLCFQCQRENAADAAFCAGCGSRLARRCPDCDRECEPDARFCSGCGRRLESSVEPPAGAPSEEAAPDSSSEVDQTLVARSGEPDPAAPGGGRYLLRSLLGEGANKRVYLAHDERLDRDVALAVIKARGLDEAGRARLHRETQAMGQLGDHPSIVTVHDILEEGSQVFIVSQFMAGGDLGRHLDAQPDRRLDPETATDIAIQICAALEHAHAKGVLHRDLKPGNIWLGEDGSAKLGDFGLAFAVDRTRLTQEGMMVGTASYMPPEQAMGQLPDARSDLYALGATLYEMVTGRPPFIGDDAVAVISQHINTRPVAPSLNAPEVSKPLEGLILELLAKDPTARPPTAAAVRERLRKLGATPAITAPPSAATNPLDRLASGVFVGREAEVERARAVFDETLSGQARILLVVGEPGIGKTRVSEELTTYARLRGAQVFWGRCHEGEGAPPFWPWVQIVRSYAAGHQREALLDDFGFGAPAIAEMVSEVRQLLPDLPAPPPLEPEQARFRLFDAVVSFLRNAARRTPLVLVLDDLHWADKPSLLLLEFLAREIGGAPLLVVATYRDVELRRRHPLAETLAELARLRLGERILLRGITEEDVHRFIQQTANVEPSASLVEAIHRETEGNPFFVHEVVRLLAADGRLGDSADALPDGSWSLEIPQGVREVVGRRLNRLSERCNELLLVASVLGREFELTVLEQVSGTTGEAALQALDEALQARVIGEVADAVGRYRFSHALMRETLYEELSTPRRVSLHRRAGTVLEAVHGTGSGSHLAEIAHHFFQAIQSGDVDHAVRSSVRAAEWAHARQAWEEEVEHYDRALQATELEGQPDLDRRCDLLVRLAEALATANEMERAHEVALEGAELARRLGSPARLARLALAYGGSFPLVEMGRVDETIVGLLSEAREQLLEEEDPESKSLLVQVVSRLAIELYFGDDWDRIGRLVEEAKERAAELDDPALTSVALKARSVALRAQTFSLPVDRWTELGDVARKMRDLARRAGDAEGQALGEAWIASHHLFRGERSGLLASIEAEERIAERHRTPMARAMPAWHRTMLTVLEGRFAEFRDSLRETMRISEGGASTNARQWGGALLYFAGRHLGQLRITDQAKEWPQRFPDYPVYRAYLCAIQVGLGEQDEGRRNFEILARDDFRAIPRDGNFAGTVLLGAESCVALGDRDRAAHLYDLLLPFAGWHGISGPGAGYLGPFDLRLGLLAAFLDRSEEAIGHLEAAREQTVALGARPFEAESRLELGRVLAASGSDERARRELERVREIARELGMAPVLEQAETALR